MSTIKTRKHNKRPHQLKKNIRNIGQNSLIKKMTTVLTVRSTKQLFVEKIHCSKLLLTWKESFSSVNPKPFFKDRRSFRISYSITETLMIIKNFKMTYLYNSLFGKKPYRSGSHKNLQITCINSVQKKWNSLQRLEICCCVFAGYTYATLLSTWKR